MRLCSRVWPSQLWFLVRYRCKSDFKAAWLRLTRPPSLVPLSARRDYLVFGRESRPELKSAASGREEKTDAKSTLRSDGDISERDLAATGRPRAAEGLG